MINSLSRQDLPEELNNHCLSFAYSKAKTLPVWPWSVRVSVKVFLSQTWSLVCQIWRWTGIEKKEKYRDILVLIAREDVNLVSSET